LEKIDQCVEKGAKTVAKPKIAKISTPKIKPLLKPVNNDPCFENF
jgi:hypothetical protein